MDGGLVHVLNRGVDKRDVVLDDLDRLRFVHDLFAFNDANIANPHHRFKKDSRTPRVPLVHIHAWCLMNNHYHLLLSEVAANGISRFSHKLGMGYTKYFNERYDRSGALWQGPAKRVNIIRDAHFLYIPFYIHLNPLDYTLPEWRVGKVTDIHEALASLNKYRWSGHLDYFGKKNFPSLIYRKELDPFIGTAATYFKTIKSIISNSNSLQEELTLTIE
jgi:putative transposase